MNIYGGMLEVEVKSDSGAFLQQVMMFACEGAVCSPSLTSDGDAHDLTSQCMQLKR